MPVLFDAALAFPSVIFTILMGVSLVYWVFVIVGALDIDLFHADADVDGLDIGHDVGGTHDIGEAGDIGGDGADAGEGIDAADAGGLLHSLGLKRVPLTISLTLIFVFSWAMSILAMHYLDPFVPVGVGRWVLGAVVFVGSIAGSLPITAVVITPIAPAFVIHPVKSRADVIGATCDVTTGEVNSDFGQATVTESGFDLVIHVRCDSLNDIARGDQALVIDYDKERHAYLIEPLSGLLDTESKRS